MVRALELRVRVLWLGFYGFGLQLGLGFIIILGIFWKLSLYIRVFTVIKVTGAGLFRPMYNSQVSHLRTITIVVMT